jgi:hypothetical protein
MAVNNLPTGVQNAIQKDFLVPEFEQPLHGTYAFRDIADRETFEGGKGETRIKTRVGKFATVTSDMVDDDNSDLDNGMTPTYLGDEQYKLTLRARGGTTDLNIVTAKVAIGSLFLQNVRQQGDQARRSLDTLAAQSLFTPYMGAQSFVTATLGSANASVHVDNINGFTTVDLYGVSLANAMVVSVGASTYNLAGATPDPTNTSTTPYGVSGTLTFGTNVSTGNGTLGNTVMASIAQPIYRPGLVTTTAQLTATSRMTVQDILNMKALMEANCVPKDADGWYRYYGNPQQIAGLHADPDFKSYLIGRSDSAEFRRGIIANIMGVLIIENSMNPVQRSVAVSNATVTVHRGIMVGQGAMIEGSYTPTGYAGDEGVGDDGVAIIDGIAYVVREPLDRLKQKVSQSWQWVGGFGVPTDFTTDSTTIPSASNAAWKRGIVYETVQ